MSGKKKKKKDGRPVFVRRVLLVTAPAEGEEGQNVHPRVAPDSAESDPGSCLTVNQTDC